MRGIRYAVECKSCEEQEGRLCGRKQGEWERQWCKMCHEVLTGGNDMGIEGANRSGVYNKQ